MDKQKIFWVVLSVSIFLVVVLVVGVFLLRQKPSAAASSETVSPLSDTGTRVYEYGLEKPQTPSLETKPNEPEVLKFVIGPEEPEKLPLPAAEPPAEKSPLEKPAVEKPGTEKPPIGKPAPKAPQERKPAVTQKPEPAKPAPQKPAPARTVKSVEYWIQTGSYKSQTKAEDLGKLLGEKGLSARVFSHTTNSDTYFRVRIGPYGNKGEADKFLAIVRQIQGLESSYVSSVSATRTLN